MRRMAQFSTELGSQRGLAIEGAMDRIIALAMHPLAAVACPWDTTAPPEGAVVTRCGGAIC